MVALLMGVIRLPIAKTSSFFSDLLKTSEMHDIRMKYTAYSKLEKLSTLSNKLMGTFAMFTRKAEN